MKSSDEIELSIGQLAGEFGLAPHVLRHWESIGLITPRRHENGRRFYGREHRASVVMVLRGKQAGLPLHQIAELFAANDAGSRRKLLTAQMAALDARLAEIEASKELVAHVLRCTAPTFTQCPHFQRLVDRQLQSAPSDFNR